MADWRLRGGILAWHCQDVLAESEISTERRGADMTEGARVGERIKKLRTEHAWSQEKLAELAGVGLRTVQRAEKEGTMSLASLNGIARALKIDAKDLTSFDDEKFNELTKVDFIPRVTSGSELCRIIGGAHMFGLHHDDPENEAEVERVGSFFQEISDTGDIWGDMEPKDHVEAGYRFTQILNELADFGFYVFAAKSRRAFRFGLDPAPMAFDFATVLALRHDNPSILKLPTGDEVAATMQTEPLRDRHFQEEIGRRGDIKE